MRKRETHSQPEPQEQEEAEVGEIRLRQLRPAEVVRKREAVSARTEQRVTTPTRSRTVAERRREALGNTVFTAFYGDAGVNHQYADFFQEIVTRLTAGQSLPEALRRASETEPRGMQRVFADVATQVEAGVPLSRAFADWQRFLPEIVVPILEAGEYTGSVEGSVRQLAQTFRRLVDIEHKFDYSVMNSGFALPLVIMLSTVPIGFLIQDRTKWFAYCLVCIVLSGIAWGMRRQLNNPKAGGQFLDRQKLRAKGGGGSLMRTSRWARTFAALWECGVPISTALETAAKSARNAHYERVLRQAAARTREGWTLHASLREARLLPPRLLEIIETGETTGDIGPALDQFADYLEDEAKMQAAQAFALKHLGPILLMAALLATAALLIALNR